MDQLDSLSFLQIQKATSVHILYNIFFHPIYFNNICLSPAGILVIHLQWSVTEHIQREHNVYS